MHALGVLCRMDGRDIGDTRAQKSSSSRAASSVSKKSFRHAVRIFKLSKKFKNTCRLNAKGAFCPLHTSPAALSQTSSARFFDSLKAAHRELLPHVKKDVSPGCHTGFQRGFETVAKTTVQQDLHRGSYCSYFTHFLTISAIRSILDSMSLTSLNWVRQRSRL